LLFNAANLKEIKEMKVVRLMKGSFLILLLALPLASLETPNIEAQSFDICLQDDGNSAVMLRINSSTGDYQFCTGSVFTGKGNVTKSGSVITLQNAAADRRIIASVDTSARSGTATFQSPPGTTRGTIRDSNTTNSSCSCR
jgi:hypothetical protein